MTSSRVGRRTTPSATAPAHRWKLPVPALVGALVVLIGVTVLLYPSASSWAFQVNQANALAKNTASVFSEAAEERRAVVDEAHAYNDALASGAFVGANTNVPTGEGSGADSFIYDDMLKSVDGVMARIRYEKAGVDLPVYHGTADATLLKGIGHLEGTSLPVGGVGTRSVLTGHRGLADAAMFTYLDRAKVGDTFTIEVQGEALVYAVTDIRIVEPDESEELLADPSRDLVTLVTCTPLGINTQRILVTGERVLPTPSAAVAEVGQPSGLPNFPWWMVAWTSTAIIGGLYVWRSGYAASRRGSD
ncbi:class C sortase [Actinomyces minihominis]|uniref:class C sortase n=1 Tax=Actinomyces minihominis TaxID=2002838 RepID=UPI000C081C7F|nr:class C sortase [Actinomyces minihominis]